MCQKEVMTMEWPNTHQWDGWDAQLLKGLCIPCIYLSCLVVRRMQAWCWQKDCSCKGLQSFQERNRDSSRHNPLPLHLLLSNLEFQRASVKTESFKDLFLFTYRFFGAYLFYFWEDGLRLPHTRGASEQSFRTFFSFLSLIFPFWGPFLWNTFKARSRFHSTTRIRNRDAINGT